MLKPDKTETVLNEGRYGNSNFNCWGATLYLLTKTQKLRWIERQKMQRFLEERTITVRGKRQVGDIVVLYYAPSWLPDGERVLTHTAVYVGNDEYIHKKGGNISEITDIRGIKKSYRYINVVERRRMK